MRERDRRCPPANAELLVHVIGTDPDRRAEALRIKIDLLVRKFIAGDEVLEAGDDLDRVRLVEFEVADIDEEAQDPREVCPSESHHAERRYAERRIDTTRMSADPLVKPTRPRVHE